MENHAKKDMPFNDYLAVKACHKSALSHVKTAKHLKKFEKKSEDTDPLRFGRIFHTALLEPDKFGELEIYSTQEWIKKDQHPEGISVNDQKKLWKEERDVYFANEQEKEDVDAMVKAIKANPVAAKFLDSEGDAEVSYFWKDPRTGLDCKTRIDYVTADDVIIEVKTDADPESEAFGKKIYNMDYHIGAWFNREGFREVTGREPKAFLFIAVEKSDPYSVGVYLMNAHDFDAGELDGVPKMMRYRIIKFENGLQDHNQGEDGVFEVKPVQTPAWVNFKLDGDGDIDAPAPSESEESEL